MRVSSDRPLSLTVLIALCLLDNSNLSRAFSPPTGFDRRLNNGGKIGSAFSKWSPRALNLLRSQSGADDMLDNDYDEEDDFKAPDFQILLAQRSFQSFFFLLAQMRDPHTLKWVDDFLSPALVTPKKGSLSNDQSENPNPETDGSASTDINWGTQLYSDRKLSSTLLHYHGVNLFNTTVFPTWDSIFKELLAQPCATLVINPNNHIKDEFEIDIDPSRLCSRILSVRNQISQEWIKELEVISTMGQTIFSSYWEKVQTGETTANGIAFDRPNLIFLESNPDPDSDLTPSPLRKGNYDVLLRLCTQESICRILQRKEGIIIGDDDGDNIQKQMANKEFLKQFYVERLYKFFKGNIYKYNGAHNFLEELMLSPPRMINESGTAFMVDPLGIAEVVMKERDRLAIEWRQFLVEIVSKGADQTEIQKTMLNRMMGIADTDVSSDNSIETTGFQ